MKCRVCGSALRGSITNLPFKVSERTIVILKDLPVEQCESCSSTFWRTRCSQESRCCCQGSMRRQNLKSFRLRPDNQRDNHAMDQTPASGRSRVSPGAGHRPNVSDDSQCGEVSRCRR